MQTVVCTVYVCCTVIKTITAHILCPFTIFMHILSFSENWWPADASIFTLMVVFYFSCLLEYFYRINLAIAHSLLFPSSFWSFHSLEVSAQEVHIIIDKVQSPVDRCLPLLPHKASLWCPLLLFPALGQLCCSAYLCSNSARTLFIVFLSFSIWILSD